MLCEGKEIILKGHPICRGIAIGKAFFLKYNEFQIFETFIAKDYTVHEIERYRNALSRTRQDIKRLRKQLEIESASEGISIIEAQLEMLQDPLLTSEVEKEIHKSQKNADYIFQQAIQKLESHFKTLNVAFFEDRFKDLQDLSRRILNYLQDRGQSSLHLAPLNSIVCAHELTACDAASAQCSHIQAFLTQTGGSTTHAAIVAKAKGIPYISNINLEIIQNHLSAPLIVDGRIGQVIIQPNPETLTKYRLIQEQISEQQKSLKKIVNWPAQTFDGFSIRLCANLDMTQEIHTIHEFGGEGIGLFRSEYMFLPKNEIPSEEEQFEIYKRIISQMKNLPVVIRTFDLGGDKIPLESHFFQERNQFLGTRSTRFLLKERSLFRAQLKAILRASVYGDVSILIPMVATLAELKEAKKMIQEARDELKFQNKIRLGCMIEVPSAAMLIDHFAKECDFFSIGTNDLIQYALAIDRGDQSLNEYHEPTDPSVIRLIHLIILEANKASVPVSVCGEMASDPRFTALLLGLGVQELSVAPHYLPLIKNAIRRTSIVEAVHLAEKVLELTSSQDVLNLLNEYYYRIAPDDVSYHVAACTVSS